MNPIFKRPLLVFLICSVTLTLLMCCFPINLFDGEVVYKQGFNSTFKQAAPLSLSYFFGLGYEEKDMVNVVDFYLVGKGYAMVFIILIGIPGLVAYRTYLKQKGPVKPTK